MLRTCIDRGHTVFDAVLGAALDRQRDASVVDHLAEQMASQHSP